MAQTWASPTAIVQLEGPRLVFCIMQLLIYIILFMLRLALSFFGVSCLPDAELAHWSTIYAYDRAIGSFKTDQAELGDITAHPLERVNQTLERLIRRVDNIEQDYKAQSLTEIMRLINALELANRDKIGQSDLENYHIDSVRPVLDHLTKHSEERLQAMEQEVHEIREVKTTMEDCLEARTRELAEIQELRNRLDNCVEILDDKLTGLREQLAKKEADGKSMRPSQHESLALSPNKSLVQKDHDKVADNSDSTKEAGPVNIIQTTAYTSPSPPLSTKDSLISKIEETAASRMSDEWKMSGICATLTKLLTPQEQNQELSLTLSNAYSRPQSPVDMEMTDVGTIPPAPFSPSPSPDQGRGNCSPFHRSDDISWLLEDSEMTGASVTEPMNLNESPIWSPGINPVTEVEDTVAKIFEDWNVPGVTNNEAAALALTCSPNRGASPVTKTPGSVARLLDEWNRTGLCTSLPTALPPSPVSEQKSVVLKDQAREAMKLNEWEKARTFTTKSPASATPPSSSPAPPSSPCEARAARRLSISTRMSPPILELRKSYVGLGAKRKPESPEEDATKRVRVW